MSMIEIRIKLQAKQKQFLKTIQTTPYTFYGGAKGGGKSKGLRLIMLLRRLQVPNSHGVIFRRTYPELDGNHIRPLLEEFPQLRAYYHESKKLLSLPNGSTLQFCHCKNDEDVTLYQGREFHDLAIDEAGQWTESMFRTLSGSNRSSNPSISPRILLTGNPGGLGHKWLKRIFIERRLNEREKPEDYAFIQALVDDNAALMDNDPDYVRRLESEPNETLRRAYRFGDWDIFAGQFFSEIRREVHLVRPFTIPSHWNIFGSYDYGYNHPAAFGLFASDEDGNVYLFRELIEAQKRVDQFAQMINEIPEMKRVIYITAGHDCWAKKSMLNDQTPPTIAEEFMKHDLMLKRANIDRIQGANQVRNYLSWQNKANGNQKPRFYIFETCPISFDCLSRMQHDVNRVEDVLKVDATEGDPYSGDDSYDMIRMGLMSRPILADPVPIKYKWGSDEWSKAETARMEEEAEEYFKKQESPDMVFGI